MAAETLSCPYCNSTVTVIRPGGAGQRLRCPRCHELFPYRAGAPGSPADADAQVLEWTEAATASGGRLDTPPPGRWSNRAVALVILSVMGTMAAIGFTFAWLTTDSRRQRDRLGEGYAAASPQVIAVPPAKLAALGYLPAGTDAIAGIHVAELMAQPATEAVLRLLRSDQAGAGLSRLQQWMGLSLDDLDHVVVGLKMQEGDLPHIFLIAQTRRPYDAQAVLARLNAKRAADLPDKKVYRFAPGQSQVGGVLWCPDQRSLVFGLQANDLADLPATPISGLGRFSEQVQKCLTETDMGKGTQAWAVGASSRWEEVLLLLQLLGLPEADRRFFNQVRTFCGRLHCDGRVNGRLECQCVDAAGAAALDRYLAGKGLDARYLEHLAAKGPRGAALFRELAQSLVRKQSGPAVLVQFALSTATLRQALSQASNHRDQAVE